MDSGFIKSLFLGNLNEELLFPYPNFSLQEIDRISEYKKENEKLLSKIKENDYSLEIKRKIKNFNPYTVLIQSSSSIYMKLLEELSNKHFLFSTHISNHQITKKFFLNLKNNQFLNKKFVENIINGKKIISYIIKEKDLNIDINNIGIEAQYLKDKNSYKLKGEKEIMYDVKSSDLFVVFARLTQAKSEENQDKLVAFLIDKKNIKIEKVNNNIKINNIHINCTVSENYLLSEEGKGLEIANDIINTMKLSLSAQILGLSKRIISHLSTSILDVKNKFGERRIELFRKDLSLITCNCYSLESILYLTTGILDVNNLNSFIEEINICRIYSMELINHFTSILTSVETSFLHKNNNLLTDIIYFLKIIHTLYNENNDILKLIIAYSSIVKSNSQDNISMTRVLVDPIKSFTTISNLFVKKISSTINNNKFSRVHESLKGEALFVEKLINEFYNHFKKYFEKYKNDIVKQDFILKRFSEISIYLYIISASISRVSSILSIQGSEKSKNEKYIVVEISRILREKIKILMNELESNKDEGIQEISDLIYKHLQYPYDILD